jgi:hypothetical protein
MLVVSACVLCRRTPDGTVRTSSPLFDELPCDEPYSQQCLCGAQRVAPVGQVDRPFAQEVFCGRVLLCGRDKGPDPHAQEKTCKCPPVHKVSNAYSSILLPLNCKRKHVICRSSVSLPIERQFVFFCVSHYLLIYQNLDMKAKFPLCVHV